MPAFKYKQKCSRCKKNYVIVTWKNKFPLCYDCQKGGMQGEITDPKLKKLLDIPEEFYHENSFLRSIKINALRYGSLSEKQIEYFQKSADKMQKEKEELQNKLSPETKFNLAQSPSEKKGKKKIKLPKNKSTS
ncbi:hypothetical protein HZC30_07485 [Candidatus Woesearchaeota archaeon]|nr:hypothetical protein [Candidatus Woesearchaeota archaeon]